MADSPTATLVSCHGKVRIAPTDVQHVLLMRTSPRQRAEPKKALAVQHSEIEYQKGHERRGLHSSLRSATWNRRQSLAAAPLRTQGAPSPLSTADGHGTRLLLLVERRHRSRGAGTEMSAGFFFQNAWRPPICSRTCFRLAVRAMVHGENASTSPASSISKSFLDPLAASSPELDSPSRRERLRTMPAASCSPGHWAHVDSTPDDDVLITESIIILSSSSVFDDEPSRPASRSGERHNSDEHRLPPLNPPASRSSLRRSLSASDSLPAALAECRKEQRSRAVPRLGNPSARLLAKSTYDLDRRLNVLKVCMQPTPSDNCRDLPSPLKSLSPERRRFSSPSSPSSPSETWSAEGDERDCLVVPCLLGVTRRTTSLPSSPCTPHPSGTPWRRSHSLQVSPVMKNERRLSGSALRTGRRTTVPGSSLLEVRSSSSCPPSPLLQRDSSLTATRTRKISSTQEPLSLLVDKAVVHRHRQTLSNS